MCQARSRRSCARTNPLRALLRRSTLKKRLEVFMCRVPTLLIALVSIALFASQLKASCPLDTLMVEYIVFSSTDPSMQQSATLNCSSPPYGTGYGRASYDLAAGTASVAVDAHNDCYGSASVSTHDVF